MKPKDITLSAIMLALLIVCSQLAVPIGPVPITLQTLAVLLVGFLLPAKNTLLVTVLYAFFGLVGLPFFSGFSGGFQSVLLPSFGFVLGFIPAAFLQATYLERAQNREMKTLILAGLINIVVTYFIGLPYMALILNVYLGNQLSAFAILMAGLIPFIPGDLVKLAISVVIAKRIKLIVSDF